MAEKLNEKKGRIKPKDWIVIILLLLILGVVTCHSMKMHKIFAKFEHAGMMMKKDMKRDMSRAKKDMDKDADKIDGKRANRGKNYSFYSKENHDQKNKQYIVEMGVPKNVKESDITIELKNDVLVVSLTKADEVKTDKSDVVNYINFSRFFAVPKTRATLKDVKHTLENGVLTVTVPII